MSIHNVAIWLNRHQSTVPLFIILLDMGLILIFPLQAVLTRLCGCDKLLQSLSLELAQLQMDKVSDYGIRLQMYYKYDCLDML